MWKAFITLVPSDRPEAQIMRSALLSFPPTATYFSRHHFPSTHQMLASRLTAYFRKKCVVVTDRRVRLMNEILGCIKFIKMYCWEDAFEQNIHSESRWNSHQSRCSFQIWGIFGKLWVYYHDANLNQISTFQTKHSYLVWRPSSFANYYLMDPFITQNSTPSQEITLTLTLFTLACSFKVPHPSSLIIYLRINLEGIFSVQIPPVTVKTGLIFQWI